MDDYRFITVTTEEGKQIPAEIRQLSTEQMVVLVKEFGSAKVVQETLQKGSGDLWTNGKYTVTFDLDRGVQEASTRVVRVSRTGK
jgi:hypothetical protein